MAIRVVLADDHPPTRAGVRAALEDYGMVICAEVNNGPAAIEAALENRPDICLLDVRMPGGGVTAAATIHEQLPETAVIMLSAHSDKESLFSALKAGASGFLLKDTDPARLPLALQGVLDGEAALPRPLTMRLIEEFRREDKGRRLPSVMPDGERLTDREWQVLELMDNGFETKDIARKLDISKVTVRRHISTVLRKLNVNSRAEAVTLLKEALG